MLLSTLALLTLSPDFDRAVGLLSDVLAQPAPSAEALREAGEAARAELVGSRLGERLAQRLAAESELREGLEETLAELRFEPVMEGDLPVGWPRPTRLEEIEVKRYPVTRLARAEMSSSYGTFMSLFRHITDRDIPMTVPVEMGMDSDGGDLRESTMGFLYQGPNVGQIEDDGRVEVLDLEPATFASLGQRGRTSPVRIASAIAELRTFVADRGDLALTGDERVLEYNGPGVNGLRRFFEVQLGVEDRAIERFESDLALERWNTIDDRVMGGVSQSAMVGTGRGTAEFRGALSLDNNGGFCSVRSSPGSWLERDARALVLRVRGDGKTYDVRLRTSEAFDGPSYTAQFTAPADRWCEVTLPIAAFRSTFRGREVPGAPALRAGDVRSIGFLIGGKQVGEFRLEVEWIASTRGEASGRVADEGP